MQPKAAQGSCSPPRPPSCQRVTLSAGGSHGPSSSLEAPGPVKGSCRPLGAWCALVSWSCCLYAYLLSHLQQLWSSMPTSEVEAGLSILLQYFTQFLCKQAGAESRRFLLACRALFPVLKVAMGSLRLLSPATMLLNFSCSSAAVLRAFTCSSHHLVAHGHHLGLGASGVSSLGSWNTCSTCGTACRMRLVDVGYPYPSLQQGGAALQGSSFLVCWSGDKTHSLAETDGAGQSWAAPCFWSQ